MAEEVGGIVYEVGMDVKGLQSGASNVTSALNQVQSSADKTSKQLGTLDTKVSQTAVSVQQASKSMTGFRTVMQQGGYQIQDFIVQVQGGQSALVAFSQQGSQLAGAFGPGGAVVGALIALGSVLAGVLMSALGNTADEMKTLQTAAENLNKVVVINSQGVAALSNDFARLAATNATLAAQLRDNAIQQYETAVKDAGKAVQSIVKDQTSWIHSITGGAASVNAMGDALSALDIKTNDYNEALTQSRAAGEVFVQVTKTIAATTQFLSSEFEISQQKAFELGNRLNDLAKNPSPEAISSLVDFLHTLKPATEDGAKAIQELETKVINAGVAMQQAKDNADSLKQSLDQLKTEAQQANFDNISKQLETQRIALSKGKQAAIEYGISQQDLTQAQKDELIAASRVVASLEEQKKKQDEAARAAKSHSTAVDGVAQKLEALRQKSMLAANSTQELSRAQAILNAEQSLGKGATQEQIKLAGEYAAAAYDAAKALKERGQAEQANKAATQVQAEAKTQVNPATGAAEDPFAKINLEETQKLALYQQYYDQGLISKQTYEDTKTSIEQMAANERKRISDEATKTQQQNMSMLLGSTSDFFGQMAGAVGDYAGESSTAYKALFAVSKGFAIAQAGMNLFTAISNAAALPWPANIPAIAFAAAQGANLISQIRGANYGGGRKNGGDMSAGNYYEVGENGLPEIFQASNGRQYMVPGNGGQMFSNKDVTSGGGGGVVVYNNITNNANARVSSSATQNSDGSVTISTIVDDINSGGQISQAISNTFDTQRKANE